MGNDTRLQVTRTIEAPPERVFAVLTDLDPDCELAPPLAGVTTGGHSYAYRVKRPGRGASSSPEEM